MICSSVKPTSGLRFELCYPSPASEREGPIQLPTGGEEWKSSTSNGLSKRSMDSFLSSSSCSATRSLQNFNACWLREDPIDQGFRLAEVGNGELSAASRENGKFSRMGEDISGENGNGQAFAVCASSDGGDAETDAELDEELTTDEELDQEGLITDTQSEEVTWVKNFVTDPPSQSGNDTVSYVNALKKCAKQQDILRAFRLHADLVESGLLNRNIIIGNALIDMYAKCGNLSEAENVFYGLQAWSVASWNTLISRHVECGHDNKALCYYECMQVEGFSPNALTFSSMLKAFGSLGDVERGQQMHAQLKKNGLLEVNVHVGTALVDMYAKCGLLSKAQDVFDKLPDRNVVSWTALIIGFSHHDLGEEALGCFDQMLLEGFSPDEFTFACAFKACCSSGNIVRGRELHTWAAKEGLLKKNSVITGALIDMYAKCGELELAEGVFNSAPFRDKISRTALINGYAQHGYGEEALMNYEQMLLDGFVPNEVTFSGLLKACTTVGALDKGQHIHAQIIREGLLNTDVHLGTALVDMYGKFGLTAIAEEVFESLAAYSLETWTAIIAAFVDCEEFNKAFHFFKCMQAEDIYPDAVTFSCLLMACGSVAALEKGQRLHLQIVKLGLVEEDTVVGTSLVDMYVNCGMLLEAQDVFNKLDVRDLVTWCVLIEGYAQFGREKAVFDLMDDMVRDGRELNDAIFTLALNACSHGGLIDKAQDIFLILNDSFVPKTEQYTCMIDLFGRAGLVEMAAGIIFEIPFCPNRTLWTTLLTACRNCGTVKLGRWSFDQAILLDEKNSSVYICMYIIYAAAGRQKDAAKIEQMQVAKQAWESNEESLTFLID